MAQTDTNRALAAFNAGRLDEARQLLNTQLNRAPNDLDALYLLGVTEQAAQRHEAALALYNKALSLSPGHAGAHYNKALLLAGLGRHEEALKHHDAAVRLGPGNFWALVNRGNTHAALRQFEAALSDFDLALKIQPDLPEALTNKGNALRELGRLEEALTHHQRALQLNPGHVAAWVNLSGAFIKARRFEQALETAERAVQLQPSNVDALTHKGAALIELGQPQQALTVLEQATRMAPGHAAAWVALGNAHEALLSYTDALNSLDRGIAIDPRSVPAWINKGSVLDDLGRDTESEESYHRALAIQPDHADAHWGLAVLLLKQHRFPEAWEHFEYRWGISGSEKKAIATARPRWDGQASDRSLLLWGEQGLGDQILYASLLPELAGLPQRKRVALDKRLIPLFQRSMPGFEFIDLDHVSDALDFAEQLPLGSLPRLLRPELVSFARAHYPFLRADESRVAALHNQIARPGKRVCGVSWWSNRKSIGKHKSINLAQMLTPLASDKLHFVNLQYGDTAAERQALLQEHNIEVQNVDEVDAFSDIDSLAALIQACDVVITTSNTTAHLAGALGKETVLLLPSGKGRLWYWGGIEARSTWYPSIRIFAQTEPGQWRQPLQGIKSFLIEKI